MRSIRSPELRDHLAGTWPDRLLLVLVLAGIVAGWQTARDRLGADNPVAEVYHAGRLLASYPLNGPPVHYHARGDLGISEVVIEHGRVRITDSPCTTRYCVHSGAVAEPGRMLACAPNRILVLVRGGGPGLDAVAE